MKQGLKQSDIVDKTGAPFYTVQYLHKCKKLPIIKQSTGRGKATIFPPESINIVEKHINR